MVAVTESLYTSVGSDATLDFARRSPAVIRQDWGSGATLDFVRRITRSSA